FGGDAPPAGELQCAVRRSRACNLKLAGPRGVDTGQPARHRHGYHTWKARDDVQRALVTRDCRGWELTIARADMKRQHAISAKAERCFLQPDQTSKEETGS